MSKARVCRVVNFFDSHVSQHDFTCFAGPSHSLAAVFFDPINKDADLGPVEVHITDFTQSMTFSMDSITHTGFIGVESPLTIVLFLNGRGLVLKIGSKR